MNSTVSPVNTLKDEVIHLDEKHTYTLILPNGQTKIAKKSVTEFIPSKPLNFDKIAQDMAESQTYKKNPKYKFIPDNITDLGDIQRLIRASWNLKGEIALDYGKAMQLLIAAYYRTGTHKINPLLAEEQKQFKLFLGKEGRVLEPVGVELHIFDTTLLLAGTINALFKDTSTNNNVLVLWKRCGIEHFRKSRKPDINGSRYQNDKLNKYELQCNVYAEILSTCYNISVFEMYLWIYNTNDISPAYVFHKVEYNEVVTKNMKFLRQGNNEPLIWPTTNSRMQIAHNPSC